MQRESRNKITININKVTYKRKKNMEPMKSQALHQEQIKEYQVYSEAELLS